MEEMSYLVRIGKSNEGRPLNFHIETVAVIESDNKMEKIAFAQIVGWLLFKLASHNFRAEKRRNETLN
jgi:hypothetical protein